MTLFQIIQLFFHALQILCKIVNIQHHAQHVIFLVPGGILLSCPVSFLKGLAAPSIIFIHFITQFRKHICILVQLHIKPFQFVQMLLHPSLEGTVCFCHLSLLLFLFLIPANRPIVTNTGELYALAYCKIIQLKITGKVTGYFESILT